MDESRVFLHEDGYVEAVLVGIVESDIMHPLIEAARALVEQHGPMHVLINGLHGRASRDAKSLSSVLNIGRATKLKSLYILTGKETDDPKGVVWPSVLASILTSALGKRPIYIDSETEARQLAAEK
jgi:hypothetical protein